jgi:hypothetical protein
MKIYRPTKTDLIVQGFGLAGTQPSLIPLYNSINLKSHNGWDFSVKCQDNHVIHGGKCEEVYCNIAGVNLTVSYIQKDDKGGYGINAIDEQGNKYCWWHFDSISPIIFVGNKLSFGQVLGVAGNTGMSTGAHLHFGYYPYGENKDNGYGGAVSPEPFYDNRFCLDIKTQIEILQKLIEFYKSLVSLWKKT